MTETLDDSKERRDEKKRDLSETACSRWYRPPEIILLDKNYN